MRGKNMTQKVHSPRSIGWFRLAAALAVAVFLAVTFQTTRIHAQALGTGTIQGTVQDQSGAVVSGAAITATNIGTNAKATAKTSPSGGYTIPDLQPGDYRVNVKASGFAEFEEQVHVEQLSQVGLNISLKVGASSEKVTISAEQEPVMNNVNGQSGRRHPR